VRLLPTHASTSDKNARIFTIKASNKVCQEGHSITESQDTLPWLQRCIIIINTLLHTVLTAG
jgi:hypothetical protein